MKYYVVSDVHGFYTETLRALTEAGFFEEKEPHKLVICGDLLDRGKEAIEMQDFALHLLREDKLIYVRGNHEDLISKMLYSLDDIVENMNRSDYFHVTNGTWDSALQLSGMEHSMAICRPDALVNRVKNTVFYKKLLPATVDFFETEHYIFVHGWIPCGTTSEKPSYRLDAGAFYDANWRKASSERWYYARWYNGMEVCYANKIREEGKTIVCGHWNASFGHSMIEGKGSQFGEDADHSPFYGDGIIAIDACAYARKKVNCIVIED